MGRAATARVEAIPRASPGGWNAVYELLPRDGAGNVTVDDSVRLDASDNFVDARGKLVALVASVEK